MSSIKDKKKKNRLQGGGGTKKKPAPKEKEEKDNNIWAEHVPDMTAAEEVAKKLKSISVTEREEDKLPEGLCFVRDFITEEEEKALLDFFENQEWDADTPLERRTQQWGYTFDYTEMTVVDESRPLPAILKPFLDRLMDIPERPGGEVAKLGTFPYAPTKPTQLIVNEYTPGQGIHAHVDRSCFGECVATLALGSHCTFLLDKIEASNTTVLNDFSKMPSFAKAGAVQQCSSFAKSIYFPRRAVILMKGDIRYNWTHEIPARTWDENPESGKRETRGKRVSLTLRTLTDKAVSNVGKRTDYAAAWQGKAIPSKEGSEKK